MTSALVPQLLFLIIGVGSAVAVIATLPDGPPIQRPRRKRTCGHRQGPWVCVQADCDGTHHYYRRAS